MKETNLSVLGYHSSLPIPKLWLVAVSDSRRELSFLPAQVSLQGTRQSRLGRARSELADEEWNSTVMKQTPLK